MYKCFFKRFFDVLASGLALVLLSVPLLIIAVAIKIDSSGSVLFKQKRVGIHKSHFYIYKFRTMYADTPDDIPTHQLVNAESHITKVGAFLRKTSLDELPQLINIFKGDMSFVGPRPALWNQYDLIARRDEYNANSVKPGLTGWAQINGRDELEIPVKARYDGEYIQKISFLFDLKCIFATFVSVFKSDGIVEGSSSDAAAEKKRSMEEDYIS